MHSWVKLISGGEKVGSFIRWKCSNRWAIVVYLFTTYVHEKSTLKKLKLFLLFRERSSQPFQSMTLFPWILKTFRSTLGKSWSGAKQLNQQISACYFFLSLLFSLSCRWDKVQFQSPCNLLEYLLQKLHLAIKNAIRKKWPGSFFPMSP